MKERFAKALCRWGPPLLPVLVWIIGMEWLIRKDFVPAFLIPPPFEVMQTLFENRAEIAAATSETLVSALAGLGLSVGVGSIVAVLLTLSPLLRRALYPYTVFFQTVPVIALAPILVIWFGFGQPTVIASSFIVSVFPVIASTLLGLESTDPALIDLFRLSSASRPRELLMLKIPFALPQIFGGLRIASGLAVIGAIVGEFIGGGGLGALVDAARTQQRIDKVFAAVLVSSILGVVLVGGVNLLSHWALSPWHASEKRH